MRTTLSPRATSLCELEEYDLRWSSPARDLVTTLGRQILTSNGLASPYSQLKWKFSIRTTQLKALKVFEPNSQAKMAPDSVCVVVEIWADAWRRLLCMRLAGRPGWFRPLGSEVTMAGRGSGRIILPSNNRSRAR